MEIQELGAIAQWASVAHLIVSHLADFVTYPVDTRQWRWWARRGHDGKFTLDLDLDLDLDLGLDRGALARRRR
ncbi:hypothetical protein ACWEQO_31910 [Streptomyces sp. NPDC004051]